MDKPGWVQSIFPHCEEMENEAGLDGLLSGGKPWLDKAFWIVSHGQW